MVGGVYLVLGECVANRRSFREEKSTVEKLYQPAVGLPMSSSETSPSNLFSLLPNFPSLFWRFADDIASSIALLSLLWSLAKLCSFSGSFSDHFLSRRSEKQQGVGNWNSYHYQVINMRAVMILVIPLIIFKYGIL